MKTKILAAIVIAATCISLLSCDWMFTKKPQAKTITGKWTIENIADSNAQHKNGMTFLALAMMSKDSTALGIEFNTDSSFSLLNTKEPAKDSGKYYLDTTLQTLFVKEDSAYQPFNIKTWTDSSLHLFSSTDSVWYMLSKK